jgi:hypothetical protein
VAFNGDAADVYAGHQNCEAYNGLLAFFRCGEGN